MKCEGDGSEDGRLTVGEDEDLYIISVFEYTCRHDALEVQWPDPDSASDELQE